MPFQTSFVLRCWLPRNYSIENIQSGEKFHSSDLAEIMRWVETVSASVFSQSREARTDPNPEDGGLL